MNAGSICIIINIIFRKDPIMKNLNAENKMNKKESRRKLLIRIFALVLSLLMVGGSLYYLFAVLATF